LKITHDLIQSHYIHSSIKTYLWFQFADYRIGVLYATTSLSDQNGLDLLQKAVDALLSAIDVTPAPSILWSAKYQQRPSSGTELLPIGTDSNTLHFPAPPKDLAFDDGVLDNVKEVWQKIAGEDAGEFLVFQDREAYDEDE
jgi:hypothetical protein